MLVDIMHEGQLKPAVVQVTKQGLVFVLDRETGEPLIPVEERPVPQTAVAAEQTSPTQPFPLWPAPLLKTDISGEDAFGFTPWDRSACAKRIDALNNQGLFTPITEEKTLMLPGSLGGANWGGGVFWEEQQLLVVNVNTTPFEGQLIRQGRGDGDGGDHVVAHGREMRVTMRGTPYIMSIDTVMSPLGVPCTPPPWGKLVAIDMKTGNQRWSVALGSVHEMGPLALPFEVNWGTPNLGGAMMTAGGLVFIAATMDRRLRAFDTRTGKILWTATLPVDATASPMTYQVDGRQYVLIAAGGHHMFQRGSGDYLIAYALDNKKNHSASLRVGRQTQ